MTTDPSAPTVYPVLTYRDADAAIDYLTGTFGFVPGEITRDDAGRIVHATLTWADGMVMLSQSRGDGSPFDLGPVCLYLVVDDPDPTWHGPAPPAPRW